MLDSSKAISPFETSSPQCNRLLIFFILGGGVFTLSIISFIVPVIVAILPAFTDKFNVLSGVKNNSIDVGRLVSVSVFTVLQAFFSALFAVLIGFSISFFCALREFKGRKFLSLLASVPLAVPPLTISIAYILFFGKFGFLNDILNWVLHGKINASFLYSIVGIIIIHSFYNFPIAMQAITQVWQRLDEELEEVASLLGAKPLRIFLKIILPELWNPILSSFLIIFLYCFFSFMIILMFGGIKASTLEVELYVAGRTTLNMHYAGTIALIETAIASIFTIGYVISRTNNAENVLDLKRERIRKKITGVKERSVFFILMSIIIIFLIAPILSLFVQSFVKTGHTGIFTFLTWKKVLCNFGTWVATFNTIWIAIITASGSILAALFFLYLNFTTSLQESIKYKGFHKFITSFLKFAPYAPLMVSSVVIGFGVKIFMPKGSVPILIIIQVARAWVFAYAQIQASFSQIPRDILLASVLMASNKKDAFLRVVVPLSKPGIKTAFAFCFAISAGDASIPLLLNIPHFENLSLLVLRLSGSYRFTESSAIAILLGLLTGFIFFVQQQKKEVL